MANHVKTAREHLQKGHEALEAALKEVEGKSYPYEGALRGAHSLLSASLSNFDHLPAEEFEEKPGEEEKPAVYEVALPEEEKPDSGTRNRPARGHQPTSGRE